MAVPPHRILVPVDFSIFSARAAAVANDFARRFHSKLTLVHVIDSSEPEAASTFGLARRVAGRLRLSQFVGAVQPTSNTRQIIAVGKTANEIAALADRSRTDLILIGAHGHGESARERFIGLLESDVAVMGRKGRSELWHFVFGSLSECIVRHASCPVLVVREREHEFLEGPVKTD
jgi:nucleotide-binding universal stress UspA family protein